MVNCLTTIAKLKINFTPQERILFAVANKSVLATKRKPLRLLDAVEAEEAKAKQDSHIALTRKLKSTIKTEMNTFLDTELSIIQTDILPYQADVDGQVFFLKLIGDYNRYKAEISLGEERNTAIENALDAYQTGLEASRALSPVNVVHLSIGLNFCLFLYEIVVLPMNAVKIATEIFEAAMDNIDSVEVAAYSDVNTLLRTLRDNLALWSSSSVGDPPKETEETQNTLLQDQQ